MVKVVVVNWLYFKLKFIIINYFSLPEDAWSSSSSIFPLAPQAQRTSNTTHRLIATVSQLDEC